MRGREVTPRRKPAAPSLRELTRLARKVWPTADVMWGRSSHDLWVEEGNGISRICIWPTGDKEQRSAGQRIALGAALKALGGKR